MGKYLDNNGLNTLWTKAKSTFATKEEIRNQNEFSGLTISTSDTINPNYKATINLNVDNIIKPFIEITPYNQSPSGRESEVYISPELFKTKNYVSSFYYNGGYQEDGSGIISENIRFGMSENNSTKKIEFYFDKIKNSLSNGTSYTYSFPNKSGTLVLADDSPTSAEQVKALPTYTLSIAKNTGGNAPVKFLTVNYSNADSENGVLIKFSMRGGHGNGFSYRFLQDVILSVNLVGDVVVDNYKYFGADITYNNTKRKFGDICWTIDTTNKIVEFYALMGQYSSIYSTPYMRLNASTKGVITQHTGSAFTISPEATQYWGNNNLYAVSSNLQNLDKENLISIIGEATTALSGLMSSQDKTNLNTLVALLKDEDDNSIVDTIAEVLAIFNQYPEGADLVSALAGKANRNSDNNFGVTQTVNGNDDTPLNLKAKHASMSNIALFNSSGTRLGNIGANGYKPYWWAGQGTSGQIALTSDFKTINGESIVGSGDISLSASGDYLPLTGGTISQTGKNVSTTISYDSVKVQSTTGFKYGVEIKSDRINHYSNGKTYSFTFPYTSGQLVTGQQVWDAIYEHDTTIKTSEEVEFLLDQEAHNYYLGCPDSFWICYDASFESEAGMLEEEIAFFIQDPWDDTAESFTLAVHSEDVINIYYRSGSILVYKNGELEIARGYVSPPASITMQSTTYNQSYTMYWYIDTKKEYEYEY